MVGGFQVPVNAGTFDVVVGKVGAVALKQIVVCKFENVGVTAVVIATLRVCVLAQGNNMLSGEKT